MTNARGEEVIDVRTDAKGVTHCPAMMNGEDRHLFFEEIKRLVKAESKRIVIDASDWHVVPSGVFGFLSDYLATDVTIRLVDPHEFVRGLYWFRCYFTQIDAGVFEMVDSDALGESYKKQEAA